MNLNNLIGSEPNYQPPVRESLNIPANAEKLVDRLFVRLMAIYPAAKSAFPSQLELDEAKQVWLEQLAKGGVLNPQALKAGIDFAAGSKTPFFPSVGQFIEWCKLESLQHYGLPSLENLLVRVRKFQTFGFEEIDRFVFTSHAEYWLITDLYSRCRLNGWTVEQFRKEAQAALSAMANRLAKGEVLPEPKKTLEKPTEPAASPEVAAAYLAKFRAMLKGRVN